MVVSIPPKEKVLYRKSPSLIEISTCVANDLNRISEILKLFKDKDVYELHISIVADMLKITPRQVYFYVDAGNTLAGLYQIKNSVIYLKTNGYFFLRHKTNKKLIKFVMYNISKNEEIQYLIEQNYSQEMLFDYLSEKTNLSNEYSVSSLTRRCASLKSWLKQVEYYYQTA